MAFTTMMAAYTLSQFPGGALADRLGGGRIIVVGGITAATGALVVGTVTRFSTLVGGVILIGLGTGVHKTVSIDQLSWRYPDRIGRLLGLFDTVGTLGGVAASLVVVLATGSREWRLLFLAAAVTGLGFVGTTIARISHHSAAVSGTDSPWRLASVVMVSARSAVYIYRPRFPMRSLGVDSGLCGRC